MAWEPIQTAIETALALAAQVDQVRLPDTRRAFDRAQRLHVEYEIEALGNEGAVDLDLGDEGLETAILQDLEITAKIYALSSSHAPDVSAYELAYRLITRAYFPEVLAALEAGNVALTRVERAVPGPPPAIDNRIHSAVSLSWVTQYRACEQEGQPPAPRPYFDRTEIGDEDGPRLPRALAPELAAEEVLAVADWRSLWLGTQTDLVGGRAWGDDAGVTHNQAPGATVGDGVLTRATVLGAAGTAEASDLDAGVLRDDIAIALVLRGPAPVARARVLSRLTAGAAAGWALDALPDGSLELQAPGTVLAPLQVSGVLDGSTWVVVVLAQAGGTLSLRALAVVDSDAAPVTYVDQPLVLGASESTGAPAGLEVALVGEADTDDPAALLAALRGALGL